MKKVFCDILFNNDEIKMDFYLLDLDKIILSRQLLKIITNVKAKQKFKIIDAFFIKKKIINTFDYIELGNEIKKGLSDINALELDCDIVLDSEIIFVNKLSYPKLNIKLLKDAYDKDLRKIYGNYLDSFEIVEKKRINNSRGYDIEFLFIKKQLLSFISKVFIESTLKVDKLVYKNSILGNLFESKMGSNMGVIIDNEQSTFISTYKGHFISKITINNGWKKIQYKLSKLLEQKFTKDFDLNDLENPYAVEILNNSLEFINDTVIQLLLKSNSLCNQYVTLDKIYLYSSMGCYQYILNALPVELKNNYKEIVNTYEYTSGIIMKAFYNNDKEFIYIPLRKKYEK